MAVSCKRGCRTERKRTSKSGWAKGCWPGNRFGNETLGVIHDAGEIEITKCDEHHAKPPDSSRLQISGLGCCGGTLNRVG